MFQHFEVSALKNVKIRIFGIEATYGVKKGFRAMIDDPVLAGRLHEEKDAGSYTIYDCDSIPKLINFCFNRYTGVSRGSKDIVATIDTTPPGDLMFIQEKNQLIKCRSLNEEEINEAVQKLRDMFRIQENFS